MRLILAPLIAALTITGADAGQRNRAAVREFRQANPCPVTGAARGPCPGFVAYHITPLCARGSDHPGNMQWQDQHAARLKDSDERRMCRRIRKAHRMGKCGALQVLNLTAEGKLGIAEL